MTENSMIKTYRPASEKRIDHIERRISLLESEIRTIRHDLNNILVKIQWVEMKLKGEL